MNADGKNIWIINQFAGTPESGWGERHYYLSQYWIKQGYSVKIISGSFNHVFNKFPTTNGKYTFEQLDGITFCWVKSPFYKALSPMRFWSMLIFAFRIYGLPVSKLGKPDIILVSSMPMFPILPAYRLKRKLNARQLIFEVRDLWPLTPRYLGNYKSYNPVILILKWFEKFAYRRSDKIVTLMPDPHGYINPISGNPGKLYHIPNGINQEVLGNSSTNISRPVAIPEGKFIVGYAGTLGIANAMEYFIEAARLLEKNTDIFFVIIGDGYLKEKLKNSASTLSNIVFLEKVPRMQVQSVIKYFDVGFISSRNLSLYCYGAAANKFFDYMLARKPVLAAYVENNDPVKLSGCGLRVKTEDPNAIRDGILRLYHMKPEERAIMGEKGYNYLKAKHDLKVLAAQFVNIFEEQTTSDEVAISNNAATSLGTI
jgi:glycosyltransferase involved in cell wall biosynthesis